MKRLPHSRPNVKFAGNMDALTDGLRQEAVPEDTPLRLDVAAALAYPDGSMTACGLRREAKRGRLVIERTAGKDYTTLAAIKRMRGLCRVEPPRHAFGSNPNVATKELAESHTPPSGSLKTVDFDRARSALEMTVTEQKRLLGNTSTANTPQQPPKAAVVRLPSRLPTS